MTIREWMATRTPAAPAPLQDRMLEMLGAAADEPSSRAATVFLETARRWMATILEQKQFARDGALDLLAVDAFMTYAYEHEAEHGATADALELLAHRGVAAIAPLVSHG